MSIFFTIKSEQYSHNTLCSTSNEPKNTFRPSQVELDLAVLDLDLSVSLKVLNRGGAEEVINSVQGVQKRAVRISLRGFGSIESDSGM